MMLLTAFCILFVIRESIALNTSNACSDCKCEFMCNTTRQLELRVADLETDMAAANGKILQWINQQYRIRDIEAEVRMQNREINQTKESLQEYESKVQSELRELKNKLIDVQDNHNYFSSDLFSILEYLKPANHNESIPIQQGSFGPVLRNWKEPITNTTSKITPISNNIFGPYSFVENEKNKEPPSNINNTEGFDCPLPEARNVLTARITTTGLQPVERSSGHPLYMSNGTVLKFGCFSFNSSVAVDPENGEPINSNFSLQCTNGEWKGGNFPVCKDMMLTTETIKNMSYYISHQYSHAKRCNFNKENIADGYDCAGYFLCLDGEIGYFECEEPLVFNQVSGYCESPSNVECEAQRHNYRNGSRKADYVYDHPNIYHQEDQIKILSVLIPTIRLESNDLLSANSLMAYGAIGELVVYPQSSVTLNCVFPLGQRYYAQELTWFVNYFNASHHRKPRTIRKQWFTASIRIDAPTENDSGIYSCIGPNGKRSDIQVLVRAVTCQPFSTGPENVVEIIYHPHPIVKSIAMTTMVTFRCPDTYEEPSINSAICTVYGYWSDRINGDPLREFDICKKSAESSENSHDQKDLCLPFDRMLNRNVTLDPPTNKTLYYVGDNISLKCKGSQILVGADTVSCNEGGYWSSTAGSRCISR